MIPHSDPKAIQMNTGRPLNTYVIYCVGATLGNFGRSNNFVFLLAFPPLMFFMYLFDCCQLKCKIVAQPGVLVPFHLELNPKYTLFAQGA